MNRLWIVFVLIFINQLAYGTDLPSNASKNPYGTGWTCDKGYEKKANQCQKVEIPGNAELTILGNDWKCKRGFSKVNNALR